VTDEPLVLLVVGFLLTSGLGGALAYVFQQRAWRHQYLTQRDDLLREQALKTFEEVSTLLDKRLYRMRRVFWAARRRARNTTENSSLNTELADYRSVLRIWNDNLNRILALVDTYFGELARQQLEFELYESYAAIGEELDEFLREVTVRGGNSVEIRAIGVRLTQLSRRVYQFNVLLLRSVRDGRLGSAAPTATTRAPRTGRTLVRFGDKGDEVRRLQRALQRGGAMDLVVDGHYGRNTEKAVQEFQRSCGIDDDGIVGPMTREALDLAHPEDEGDTEPGQTTSPNH
jgi:nucleotide-binding universal stress UspA family protein